MEKQWEWRPDAARNPESEENAYRVRLMEPGDLPAVVAIDKKHSGRDRSAFLREKFDACIREPGINTSLIAESDGIPVGCLFGRLFFGEFGIPSTRAVLDTIGVHPAFGRKGVGHALIAQYAKNLRGLRVHAIDTLVDWERGELTDFFRATGFRLSRAIDLQWDTVRYRFTSPVSDIRVHRAQEADLPLAVAIGAESGMPAQSNYFARKLAAAQVNPDKNLFVVAVDGKAVKGIMLGSLFRGEFGIEETRGVIDILAVKEAYQHQGVASAIIINLLERVRHLNVSKMETLVRWNNWPLLRFLDYVGFRPSGRVSLEWILD